MKRKDLAVGMEVYYDRSSDWADRGYYAQRVVVVTTDPVRDPRPRFSRQPFAPVVTDRSNLVHVRDAARPNTDGFLVTLTSLRGPWAETSAAVAAAEKARKDRDRAEAATRTAVDKRRGAVEDAARRRDIDARRMYNSQTTVSVPFEALAAMLEALPPGWKYTKD